MGILLWLLFDLGVEIVGELVLEFTRALDEDRAARPVAIVWFVMLGLAVGAASGFVVPDRVLRPGPFVGVSLLLVPALLGGFMELWGAVRTSRGRRISHLATWYGGAAMGLGLAAGRLGAMAIVREL